MLPLLRRFCAGNTNLCRQHKLVLSTQTCASLTKIVPTLKARLFQHIITYFYNTCTHLSDIRYGNQDLSFNLCSWHLIVTDPSKLQITSRNTVMIALDVLMIVKLVWKFFEPIFVQLCALHKFCEAGTSLCCQYKFVLPAQVCVTNIKSFCGHKIISAKVTQLR